MTGDWVPPALLWAVVRVPQADPPAHPTEVVVMFATPAEADTYATYQGYDDYSIAPVTFAVPLFPDPA